MQFFLKIIIHLYITKHILISVFKSSNDCYNSQFSNFYSNSPQNYRILMMILCQQIQTASQQSRLFKQWGYKTHNVYVYSLAVTVLTIANKSLTCWNQMSKYVVITILRRLGTFPQKNHICSINQAQIKRYKVKQYHTQWITDLRVYWFVYITN